MELQSVWKALDLVAFAAALGVMPLDMPESVLVRFKGEMQPGITLRDLVNAIPYAAIQKGLLTVSKEGKKNIFSGRCLEIEGLPNLKVEQAFELSDASAERSASGCTVRLNQEPIIEYLKSKGEADWTEIEKVKNNQRMHIPVFANGDINTPERAMLIRDHYGLDGAMIGRASIGNPWFFNQVKHFFKTGEHLPAVSIKERVAAAKKHLEMSIAWKGERLGVFETRRHYTNYFKGIQDFKPFRQKLVTSDDSVDVFATLEEIYEKFNTYEFA